MWHIPSIQQNPYRRSRDLLSLNRIVIIFAAAVVAFVGLPKHQKKDDDTV
jgi:hypothetical protein